MTDSRPDEEFFKGSISLAKRVWPRNRETPLSRNRTYSEFEVFCLDPFSNTSSSKKVRPYYRFLRARWKINSHACNSFRLLQF